MLRVDRRVAAAEAVVRSVTVEQVADTSHAAVEDQAVLEDSRRRVAECLRGVHRRIGAIGADALAQTAVPLQGVGIIIRSRESNLGNMLADMVRAFYAVDVGLVNSGSIRCDRAIQATIGVDSALPPGKQPLTVRDLIEMLPFDNAILVKRITSDVLIRSLETSFSDVHFDGRFLQYSGLRVVADWSRREGSRVLEAWQCPRLGVRKRIRPGGDRELAVAMVAFIADGFDGYGCLRDQETLVSEEAGVTNTQLLLRTLGYQHDREGGAQEVHDDAVRVDELRFKRARDAISTRSTEDGLPIVAPATEGRIVTVEDY
ncbi:5'-nucleotidase [Colletotrichum falcatum]|nr:5'-nucleotidase [Colletotrichum falcatum]